jgi:hypothetical protein
LSVGIGVTMPSASDSGLVIASISTEVGELYPVMRQTAYWPLNATPPTPLVPPTGDTPQVIAAAPLT